MISLVNLYEPSTRLVSLTILTGPVQVIGLIFSFVATAAFLFVFQLS